MTPDSPYTMHGADVPAPGTDLQAERDAAYRAGQEAMRERCAALCDDWEAINYCDDWMAMELGAQQCAETIRALEVE